MTTLEQRFDGMLGDSTAKLGGLKGRDCIGLLLAVDWLRHMATKQLRLIGVSYGPVKLPIFIGESAVGA